MKTRGRWPVGGPHPASGRRSPLKNVCSGKPWLANEALRDFRPHFKRTIIRSPIPAENTTIPLL